MKVAERLVLELFRKLLSNLSRTKSSKVSEVSLTNGCVAQLARAAISKVAGRGFESLRTRSIE